MSVGKLHTYPNNPRAFKALIAAKYNKVELEVPSFTFGVTNKEASFLQKFPFGKVPALETSDGHYISESNAIAYYVAASKKDTTLFGNGSAADAARVQMFINIADNEITPAAATWIYPILGFVPYNKENTEKAKADIKKALVALNNILLSRTFLVGEAPTLADIHVVVSLLHLYKMVLDPAFRGPFGNVTRYFTTMINQPEFKAVVGEVVLCEKAAVYDPNNVPKAAPQEAAPKKEAAAPKEKAEKPAPKKEAAPKEEKEEDYEDKPAEVAIVDSSFNLEAWKRFYSNNDEKEAIKHFWENIDLNAFSIWVCKYKYNDENKMVFMTCNLLGGFFQRCDHLRKIAFSSFGVFGKDNDNEIHGIWIFQGQEVPQGMLEVADYESYEFTKVTDFNEENKMNVNAFLAWGNIDGVAKFAGVTKEFNQGKNFK